jgi:hypothetical protein
MDSNKDCKANQRRAYRSMWPRGRATRHKWAKLGRQPKCVDCKTRHPVAEACPVLPRVKVVK